MKHLFDKRERLNGAVVQLKKEFIGIDTVIDQIAAAITSWYFFPEMQDRPVVINQEEIDRASIRSVWDLLDSGTFDIVDFEYNISWFHKLIKRLDMALYKGVTVEKGIIVANEDIYWQSVNTKTKPEEDIDDEVLFVSDDELDTIFDLTDHLFLTKDEIREKLRELNGEQTIDYLITLFKASVKPRTVDCTKALIFVMGNLDEVYTMSRNFNPDMSANEFHRQSAEITVTEVKQALLGRFRSEQIARLGNNHIIYPAFDEDSFYGIIRLELEKVKRKVVDIYGLQMNFDRTVEQLIYEEGVYPTQGTRPVFTTVHQIVNTRLGNVLNEIYLNGFTADTLLFSVNQEASAKDHAALQVDFIKEGSTIHSIVDQQPLVLGKLRQEKRNDEQAIVAVHESGHAILSSVLMKTVPEIVFSVTADSKSEGFVLSRPEWNYISKKEVINRLAVLLGGLVAERIVFGEENVTVGSSSDLGKATQLATYVFYACGMGDVKATFGNENLNNGPATVIFDTNSQTVNEDAKELLVQAEKLAEQTLREQRKLLIRMASYLSDHRSMNKAQVKDYLGTYAEGFCLGDIIEDADHLFYREHLKKLVEKL